MARWDTNRLAEMEVFVRVVELGNFSLAAVDFRLTPSAISKLVSRLEGRLGARLLHRTTRRLRPTPEGQSFYEKCVRILADVDEAERDTAGGAAARGEVRVSASIPFGRQILLPLVPDFLARFPKIGLDITLTDQVVNLVQERIDVAIRHGPLDSSSLVARKLGETRMVVVGAPKYLDLHGCPASPADLAGHNRLDYGYERKIPGWTFMVNGEQIMSPPLGNVKVSDGEGLRQLALAGAGLARLNAFQVAADIQAGKLVPLLEAFNPGDTDPVHAVFLGQRTLMPARVRALLDYLVANVRLKPIPDL
jgi:DNA-binding transcriptional LysR family regulator